MIHDALSWTTVLGSHPSDQRLSSLSSLSRTCFAHSHPGCAASPGLHTTFLLLVSLLQHIVCCHGVVQGVHTQFTHRYSLDSCPPQFCARRWRVSCVRSVFLQPITVHMMTSRRRRADLSCTSRTHLTSSGLDCNHSRKFMIKFHEETSVSRCEEASDSFTTAICHSATQQMEKRVYLHAIVIWLVVWNFQSMSVSPYVYDEACFFFGCMRRHRAVDAFLRYQLTMARPRKTKHG
ncbi:hypothetical protein BC835DRAFT_971729 [Cytidiella melzeri]|nr:hypothetical protein BC835DRAFT_971729 [Cytidiella melzeri]